MGACPGIASVSEGDIGRGSRGRNIVRPVCAEAVTVGKLILGDRAGALRKSDGWNCFRAVAYVD